MTRSKKLSIMMITLGVLCFVSSAIISFYIVNRASDQQQHYDQAASECERNIALLWQDISYADSRADMAILFSELRQGSPELIQYYAKRLIGASDKTDWTTETLMQQAETTRQNRLEQINDLYADKIDADEAAMEARNEQDYYSAIALFMQLVGLVLLILGRDLPV